MQNIENVLNGFERSVTEHYSATSIRGITPLFTLIERNVWENIFTYSSIPSKDVEIMFQRLFGDLPLAQEIYRGNIDAVSLPIRELIAITNFLEQHQLPWRPAEDQLQHYEEMEEYFADAKQKFASVYSIQNALDVYGNEVLECFREDED
jgi:hypothetical protein